MEDVEAEAMIRGFLFTSVQQTCFGNMFILSEF